MEREYLSKQLIKAVTLIVGKLVRPGYKEPKGGEPMRLATRALYTLEKEMGAIAPTRLADYVVNAAYAFKDRPSGWKLNQMLGPKSFQRFAVSKGLKHFEDIWLATAGLHRSDISALFDDLSTHPKAKFISMPSEERTKRRLINTDMGYFICQTSTLGWSPCSEACSECSFTEKCKTETESKYPEIYRLRKEYASSK